MSSVLGGTTVTSPTEIANRLNGMVIPGAMEANGNGHAEPTPQSLPPPILNPNSSILGGIEIPQFDDSSEEPTERQATEALIEDEIETDLPDTPAAENFKKLRGVVKSERQAKKELEKQLQETMQRLEGYEKGESIPEVLRAKDERIAQLEPYEKVLNLKMSPEYQRNFVEPALQLRTQLEKLGKDYGLPEEVMHNLVGIENQKQLGEFIGRHFDAPTGLEVRNTVKALQELGAKAIEAEKEPEVALQSLKARYREKEESEKQERAKIFETVAHEGWNKALEKTKAEGVYKELILHPTDLEFNKKVVEPLQHRASMQYGGWVKRLFENGLKTLPDDLAVGMARSVLLSIGGALLMDAKAKAESERNAVIQHTKRTNGYIRPNMGGSNGSAHQTKAPEQRPLLNPKSAGDLAAKIFNK